jgi:hypothetical protein
VIATANTFFASLSSGSASATARADSRESFQAISTRSPIVLYSPTDGMNSTGRPHRITTALASSAGKGALGSSRGGWPTMARSEWRACKTACPIGFPGGTRHTTAVTPARTAAARNAVSAAPFASAS